MMEACRWGRGLRPRHPSYMFRNPERILLLSRRLDADRMTLLLDTEISKAIVRHTVWQFWIPVRFLASTASCGKSDGAEWESSTLPETRTWDGA